MTIKIDGKELKITESSFSEAMALEKSIASSLKNRNINLEGISSDIVKMGKDGKLNKSSLDLSKASGIISTIIQSVLTVACSDEIEQHLFNCAERAIFNGSKVDRDFFEKTENRQYYYPIMSEVIAVNVGPFLKGAGLLFKTLGM